MLTRLGEWARRWCAGPAPWTNVYGLARSLMALGTALTLIANPMNTLFRPTAGASAAHRCEIGLFCLTGIERLDLVRWLCVAALLVVASGWRPRWTAPVHAFIACSLHFSATVVDGGDTITANLSLLLLPVALTDPRRWHWDPPTAGDEGELETMRRLLARTALVAARVQVAGVYLHAAVGKWYTAQWADGTAIYYWFTQPDYGAPAWLMPALRPLIHNGATVALITWGVVALELALAAALVMPRRYWTLLLYAGWALHAGIALIHGLISFGIAMAAALVLFLRPFDHPFQLQAVSRVLGTLRAATRRLSHPLSVPVSVPAGSGVREDVSAN